MLDLGRRRAELGQNLLAHCYVSHDRAEIAITAVVVSSIPFAELAARVPPDVHGWSAAYEIEQARLPLDSPVQRIGEHMVQALVAMRVEPLDPQPWDLQLGWDSSYLDISLRADEHWLHYDPPMPIDFDDAYLTLDAAVRIGATEAVIGNWLLRLNGAYRALERTRQERFRDLEGEVRGIG